MDLDIASVADDPGRRDLRERLTGMWPEFMRHDPTAALYYADHLDVFPEHTLLAVDRATGEPVAQALSVPISFDGDPTAALPETGWNWAIRRAAHDRLGGTRPAIVSALEIAIRPDARGTGISARMLAAMRDNARALGFRDLVAPVRPSAKHLTPHQPIDGYAAARRADGLPVDPWLRVHVRAGGRIVNVAHSSMVITGTLAEWRSWTGLPFDVTGPVVVPGALVPVHCDAGQDLAVYVEPNVWVHHPLA